MAAKLTPTDRAALMACVEKVKRQSPARAAQIASKLRGEPWAEVAEFCAYSCQCDSLNLQPWQYPPCWITDIAEALLSTPDDAKRIRSAALLLQRMLAAGVSKFHPDPLAALDAAERARA